MSIEHVGIVFYSKLMNSDPICGDISFELFEELIRLTCLDTKIALQM